MSIQKVGNFVKGNIAGTAAAAKSVLILRPVLKGSEVALKKCYHVVLPHKSDIG